ncbi:MAG TPA: hypothetical protein VHR45_17100 [Thermoanaerobaculia bacterium]|nr:hypothetical protein [Thermoanaerobaculia bacterium]
MTSANASVALTRLDRLHLDSYRYLTEDDECYFLREYSAGQGFWRTGPGSTNDLILDLKKRPERRFRPEWRWKERAIEQFAGELAAALDRAWLATATLVPIPPSAVKGSWRHDDRVLSILRQMVALCELQPGDVRELVIQTADTRASSRSRRRLRPAEIAGVYALDESLCEPPPRALGLFDDVLTSGAHFRAAKDLLARRFPGCRVTGFFLARTLHT